MLIKNIDPKIFPPCRRVLLEQIKKAWNISRLYKTETTAYPAQQLEEIDYGWKLDDNHSWTLIGLKGSKFQQILKTLKNWKNQMKKWSMTAAVINPIMNSIMLLCLLKVYLSKFEKLVQFLFGKFRKMFYFVPNLFFIINSLRHKKLLWWCDELVKLSTLNRQTKYFHKYF